jgi:hypothetical protein
MMGKVITLRAPLPQQVRRQLADRLEDDPGFAAFIVRQLAGPEEDYDAGEFNEHDEVSSDQDS